MPSQGFHQKNLYLERLGSIIGLLKNWRLDSFIPFSESEKSKGRILPFIRGLRFSSQLIYATRQIIKHKYLTNWGHLLDDDGNYCSSECDIIIHKDEHHLKWNGGDEENKGSIMDFHFVSRKDAIVVISCKSYLKYGQIDKNYCKDMKKYNNNVWLFAECCPDGKVSKIRKEASKAGYKEFFYLYTWDGKNKIKENENGWLSFIEKLKKL